MQQRNFTPKPMPWNLEATVEASASRRTVKASEFIAPHITGVKLSSTLRCAFRDDADPDAPLSVPVRVTVERGRIVIERADGPQKEAT